MKLQNCKIALLSIGIIASLLIITPSIILGLYQDTANQYSELYLLGANHQAEFTSKIFTNARYQVYVIVSNHLGSLAYYKLNIKVSNQTIQLPNIVAKTPSELPPIYEYQFAIPNDDRKETSIDFSFLSFQLANGQHVIGELAIGNDTNTLTAPAVLSPKNSTYTYGLIFELWTYNSTISQYQYDNCATWLQMNVTQTN